MNINNKQMKSFVKRVGTLLFLVWLFRVNSYAEVYSGDCGYNGCDSLQWKLETENKTLEIYCKYSGCVARMADYSISFDYTRSYDGTPWNIYNDCINNVVLSGVSSIGASAFQNCSGLTSITIPESVTSIGNYAFSGCSGLISITIPESVNSIGNYVFQNCRGLTSVAIPENVSSIGNSAFLGCSGLTSIIIPNRVTSISTSAFSDCRGLTSVTIPDGVTSIGNSAFQNCRGLASVAIPESVTSIGSYAFSGCSGLTSITIPNRVTSIGSSAFYGCSGLTSIIIPNNVTNINGYTFYGCSGLTSISIPNRVTSIGSSAFQNCTALTAISIPNSVITIGNSAFEGCNGLLFVTIGCGISNMGERVFVSCPNISEVCLDYENVCNLIFASKAKLQTLTIGEHVKSISYDAFHDCNGITSVLLNSNAITSANYSASSNIGKVFGNQVKEYVLGDEIKRIGSYAFANSTDLTSIVMGRNMDRIQEYAFNGCGKLEEVRIENAEPPIVFENAFHANAYYATLYVPEGSQAEYKEDNVWKKFSRIRAFKDEPEKCNLAIKSAIGGCVEMECAKQTSHTFTIKVETGWRISSVSFNGKDVTTSITDGTYTTPLLEGDSELNIVFELDDDSIDEITSREADNQLRVTTSDSVIYIHNGNESVNTFVYTADGKQKDTMVLPHGMTKIPVQPNNVYILKVGNRTFKVAT